MRSSNWKAIPTVANLWQRRGSLSPRNLAPHSQPLVSVGVLVLGVWVAWMASRWIAAEDLTSLIYAALGVVGCVIVLAIVKDWRSGFYIFVVWLLFEDFIRKYMGNNMAIYFAKDALVAITYFSFLASVRRREAPLYHFPFMFFWSLFFWLGIMQCFNSGSPSLLYSLLGFKLYFYYVPLLFVGYALIRTDKDLRRFLTISMGLAGAIAALGIVQSIVGPSFLNPRVIAPEIQLLSTLYRVAPVSGAILYQPNSVFVSAGRFDLYLLLAWLMGLGSAGYLLLRRRRGQIIIFAGLAIVAVATVLCGGRGALLYAMGSGLILAAAFLWGAPWRWGQAHRLLKMIWRTAAAAGIAVLIAVFVFPEAVGARWSYYAETILPGSPAEELTARLESYPVQEFERAFTQGGWVLGHGIGTASLGVQYVSRWLGQQPPDIGVESGYGSIVLEYGILGLFLWWLWTAALLISAWKIVRKLRQTVYFPLAFAFFWYAFLILYPMTYGSLSGYQDYILNAYLWLLIGILFRLPALADEPAHAVKSRDVL
jgi:hypothetical protein